MKKILFPFTWLADNIKNHPRLWISRLLLALGPFAAYLAVEILEGNNPFKDIALWRVAWNIGWYIAIFAIFWLITGRRRRLGAGLASVVCFGFGLANHYVFQFRGTALFPIDLLSWRTAANVASGYDYTPDKEVYIAAGILVLYLALLIFLFREKKPVRARALFTCIVAGCVAVFLGVFFFSPLLPSVGLYAEQWQTRRNGFTFNFMLSLRYSYLGKPEGYSLEAVEEIIDRVIAEDGGTREEAAVKPTNVIVIMNESLSDLSIFENLSASDDSFSFTRSLTENTVSGRVYSPVFGGGTANVEYEALTGNSAAFLPDGTVAYQLYIDSDTPSLASFAKDEGYTSYAFHPYYSSGWNRIQAYKHLGFDEQLYDTDVTRKRYVRRFISDRCDYEFLTKLTEKDEGSAFIFNVTMQNHSGYALRWTNLPHDITLTGGMAGISETAEQYLNLVKASDDSFKWLIDYYSKCDEPTLIVVFGDHQPSLENEFYDALYGKPYSERTGEENFQKFVTPFVMWANYDIEERSGLEISPSLLNVLISDAAGFEGSHYTDFLRELLEKLPVVHEDGYIDPDGQFVSNRILLTEEQQSLLRDYEYLSYYNLFDRGEDDEFFK